MTPFVFSFAKLSFDTESYQKDIGKINSPKVTSNGRDKLGRKKELLKFSVNENIFGVGNRAAKYKSIKQAVLNGQIAEISFSKHPRASYQEIRSIVVDGKSILTHSEHHKDLSKIYILWAILFTYSTIFLAIFIKYWIDKIRMKEASKLNQ